MTAVFLRVLEAENKAAAMRALVADATARPEAGRFVVDPGTFANLPRSPFAYWASDAVRDLFSRLPRFANDEREAWMGLSTGANFQWLRLCWEIPPKQQARGRADSWSRGWVHLSKGGEFSPFYSEVHMLVDWSEDGGRLNAWKKAELFMGRITANNSQCWNQTKYFRSGLTWSGRSQKGFSARMLPDGTIFGSKGPTAFAADDDKVELAAFAALFNASIFRYLIAIQMAFGSYEVGVIQRTPVPDLSSADESTLATLARRAWSLKRGLDICTETSHVFTVPALMQVDGATLVVRAEAWRMRVGKGDMELAAIQTEIDERCFELYGIDKEDRRAIIEGLGDDVGVSDTPEEEAEDDTAVGAEADAITLTAELASWAVGVAFGRFDVRLATGSRQMPPEPEPFDPLPVCSPAMLIGDDGLPVARPPARYPLSFPDDGILVDDPGHSRDLTASVRAVVDVVFGSRADELWQEAAALLDPRNHELRRWLASGFFDHHLRRHSRSRRKAPILWQLAITSGRYSVWCYAHRMTRDSLFVIQNDVVAPKFTHEERRLASFVAQAGPTHSARERAEIAAQEALVDELRTLLDEVRRVAPLWNPNLDDGIVLVMAPLWRLVPVHSAWQKELRAKWGELVAGNYDWAHIAMHLWPERVVPKCATDRSLAIAHDIEDVFWFEGPNGKWTGRATPTRPINDLVAERSSPAVKAALASLLDAPEPAGGGRRRGRNAGVSA